MKKLSLVLAVTLIMLIALIGAAFAEKVDNYSIANTVEVAADSGEVSKDITVKPGGYIKVILYANGGGTVGDAPFLSQSCQKRNVPNVFF